MRWLPLLLLLPLLAAGSRRPQAVPEDRGPVCLQCEPYADAMMNEE